MGGSSLGMKLAQYKVLEVQLREMRDMKYLTKKLSTDMASTPWVRVDVLSLDPPPLPPLRINSQEENHPDHCSRQ